MRYGFVIDHRKCIGCHACTVACKEENQVPLGTFRTWVKYVEKGTWPHTRRYFSVLRCNHCDDAPCVTICPTVALYRRADGIVDFDGARCIGCKSCMQAVLRRALYRPEHEHRGQVPLLRAPAGSRARARVRDRVPRARHHRRRSRRSAHRDRAARRREQVEVRKPEQGTRPKVYYVGADSSTLSPTLQRAAPTWLWASGRRRRRTSSAWWRRCRRASPGRGARAPRVRRAARATALGRAVSAYLWTKSIAAGALLVSAIAGSAWWGRRSR